MMRAVLIVIALAVPHHGHHHHIVRHARPDCRNVQTMTTQWLCEREHR